MTLGLKEQSDVLCIINHVKQQYKPLGICLWGRSMGAVTSLMFCYNSSNSIQALVVDSPFSSAKGMIKDTINNLNGVPKWVISAALIPIASTVHEKTGHDVLGINIKNLLSNITVPSFWAVAD